MPSKIAPMSVRLPPAERRAVELLAESDGISVHAELQALVREGMAARTHPANRAPTPREILAQAEKDAAHLAKPAPKRKRWSVDG